MSNNAEESAFPVIDTEKKSGFNDWGYVYSTGGLTKREWYAGMALSGLLSANIQEEYGDYGRTRPLTERELAQKAVMCADALLAELEKQQP